MITSQLFCSYMFYVMAIGLVYIVVQIPFAAYYMKTKKHLINNIVFLSWISSRISYWSSYWQLQLELDLA